MNKKIKKYDERGNLIYHKYSSGFEYWFKYDENNNQIYWKRSDGWEELYKYNENNNLIYYKDIIGFEYWYKYDENGEKIEITKQEYNEIEFRKKEKEYNSRTKCSRFELIDI